MGGAPRTSWGPNAVSTTRAGSPAPRPRPGPPGGAQLCLRHEVAGQLLTQLDAAPQRRLTEGTVQQDLVRLADPEIVAEEAEMLLGVFLPRDLHAWLAGTEATEPPGSSKRFAHSPLPAMVAFSGNKTRVAPEANAPILPTCLLVYVTPHTSARLRHGARALRGVPLGAGLTPGQGNHWVREFPGAHMRSHGSG